MGDTECAGIMSWALNCIIQFLGTIGAIAAATNGTALALLGPLSIVYYQIYVYFVATNTEIRRLDVIALSPVMTHFSQTISGVVRHSCIFHQVI